MIQKACLCASEPQASAAAYFPLSHEGNIPLNLIFYYSTTDITILLCTIRILCTYDRILFDSTNVMVRSVVPWV
jgi:hypothetical protein